MSVLHLHPALARLVAMESSDTVLSTTTHSVNHQRLAAHLREVRQELTACRLPQILLPTLLINLPHSCPLRKPCFLWHAQRVRSQPLENGCISLSNKPFVSFEKGYLEDGRVDLLQAFRAPGSYTVNLLTVFCNAHADVSYV